ncbi:hypothetical protein B0A52_03824 [Exophiala mesophila]|uniref:Uncharacterized protein n=1 Tax=Exophiala mesophila TaxID=212818 RepID=A0A438N792_EXOME|nr:hypothetical protein B0A52_03824 [Exophiala mesophila]
MTRSSQTDPLPEQPPGPTAPTKNCPAKVPAAPSPTFMARCSQTDPLPEQPPDPKAPGGLREQPPDPPALVVVPKKSPDPTAPVILRLPPGGGHNDAA